mmetsp:Transcript_57807/g.137640  ORF Transcript_57807/g.137640 Transcript_57807/m.137640 type:complete len:469 (+) Transcript_57807:136-1542(+)
MGSSCSTLQHAAAHVRFGQKAVVIVPGMCSNALESKMEKKMSELWGENSFRTKVLDWWGGDSYHDWELSYVNVYETVVHSGRTFRSLALQLEHGHLPTGELVPTTSGLESEVRCVTGLDGIATLNPGELPPVKLWAPFIDEFGNDYGLLPLNYDWRRWGDPVFAHEVLADFQEHVETALRISGQQVTLVAHSMGASVTLWCLSQLGDHWTQSYLEQVILCAPAASGAPCMFPCYCNGPGGAVGLPVMKMMPLQSMDSAIAHITSSWPCMVAEFPVNVGGIQTYPPDRVFASHKDKKYTINDVDKFLQDVTIAYEKGSQLPNHAWKIGMELWPYVKRMAAEMKAPPVPTHIIYSKSVPTIQRVRYAEESMMEHPQIEEYEPGDDTITAASIEAMAEGWKRRGAFVALHPTPVEQKVNHQTAISSPFSLKVIQNLLEGKDVVEGADVEMSDDEEDPNLVQRLKAMWHHYL